MYRRSLNLTAALLAVLTIVAPSPGQSDFRPFSEVSKGYEKVVSTTDGSETLYGLWIDPKKEQLIAELPRGWQSQRHYIAVTQASGSAFAGLQGPVHYVYWKRYGTRIALIAPELNTRSQGETESKDSVKRLFTDQVMMDLPILCMGPNNNPVIDLDDLLVGKANIFGAGSMNARLATIVKAKAFPQNIEIRVEAPGGSGKLSMTHFSISNISGSSGYKPRHADERIGYFTTVFRDLGEYDESKKWNRYINRWHLEKRDSKLSMSPPKEPLVYYIEHTVPVRYRRWLRQGVLYWNDAFSKVGLDNAIVVHFQDKATGVHMEKDPEDVRYNFIRWLNNDISTAIGPSRAHPLTGEILDADIVLTDGWIRAYWGWYFEDAPDLGVENFDTESMAWLEEHPEWDPRLLLASPQQKREILALRTRSAGPGSSSPAGDMFSFRYLDSPAYHTSSFCDENCSVGSGLASHMAMSRLSLEVLGLLEDEEHDPADLLDGIPEWFIGPLFSELVCHEVGHTLGLRHNFKSSSIYSLAQINSDEWKGNRPLGGSVMDYLPPNFNMESGEVQGDFAMIGIGPYDYWAIEYGYTFGDTKDVLARVNEPELVYLTDDDTGGPDPLARRYDFSADPLEYAENQMRIVDAHRTSVIDSFVKDGESWSRARRGYERTLSAQIRAISMMSGWIGGTNVSRNRKGDPDGTPPLQVIDPGKQRKALQFIYDRAFDDAAFGLTPELLDHMTVDKWSDQSEGDRSDPTWPVNARIMGLQQSAITMVLNPTTLMRVHDNEYRSGTDDALTLPEVIEGLVSEIYKELIAGLGEGPFTNRAPAISSFRRNLQTMMTDRLITLADGDSRMPPPVRTLAMAHLRDLNAELNELTRRGVAEPLDSYTAAHVADLEARISTFLNGIYSRSL